MLGVEALLEPGEGVHAEDPEEPRDVRALRLGRVRGDAFLDEAALARALLDVLERDLAADGGALAGKAEVDLGRSDGDHRDGGSGGVEGGRDVRRRGGV